MLTPSDQSAFRAWCWHRAVHKHGWWSRGVTALYILNTIVLATQATTTERAADAYSECSAPRHSAGSSSSLTFPRPDYVFLGFTVAYLVDVIVRITGLGRAFLENGWNVYDLAVISGTVATTLPIVTNTTDSQAAIQLQKVFLVALIFKLVQRNDELHQLFKTAVCVPVSLELVLARAR